MGFNLAAEGQILVFPLAELVEVNPLVQTQIETLQTLLTERGTVPSGELPLLPLTNSAQVFHAQVFKIFDDFCRQVIHFILVFVPVLKRDICQRNMARPSA